MLASLARRVARTRLPAAASGAAQAARCMSSGSGITDAFLQDIPKTDIHVHLDGSLRLSTIIDLAKSQGIELPSYDEEELQTTTFKEHFGDLFEYLECFAHTNAVMNTPDNLRRVAYEFAVDNYAEGVRYFEVRYAPQLHAGRHEDLDMQGVMKYINEGLAMARDEFNAARTSDDVGPEYQYGIIVCALRMVIPQMSPYYANLIECMAHEPQERIAAVASEAVAWAAVHARDELGLPIVALDIAGAEDGFPAKPHQAAFDVAHAKYLGKTVHAGEAYGPESVRHALVYLHAQRIGHGFNIVNPDAVSEDSNVDDPEKYVNNLIQYSARNNVTMEVCLTSNEDTIPWLQGNLRKHAFPRMIDNGLRVSLCTDNRLISRTTTVKELRKAVDAFELTPKQLKRVVMGGFEAAFFPTTNAEHQSYIAQASAMYDDVQARHGVF